MVNDTQNKKESDKEMLPFNISDFSKLHYIKIIYADSNNELCEIRAEDNAIKSDVIQLHVNSKTDIEIDCPVGVVLKFVNKDAIYFTKTILQYVKKSNDKYIFVLKPPKKMVRQQNRRFNRININCPCVLLLNNDKNNSQTFIAQSMNISKGGVLICDVESLLSYKQVELPLAEGDCCNIAIFLRHDIKIKTRAKFLRTDLVDNSIRYAFQFINMQSAYIEILEKYLTNEELKLLKLIKN